MIALGAPCASYDCPSGKRWSDEMLRIVMIAFGKFKIEGQAYHHICVANSSRLALPNS